MLTLILIFINVLIFFTPYVINFRGPTFSSFDNFLMLGWKDNAQIQSGEYYRIVTSNFLHADSMHLFVNMFSLYNIGPSVNMLFGNLGFSLIYFLSGAVSSFTSFSFNPNPSIGASGAIFGLVGALLAVAVFTGDMSLLNNILVVIAINVAIAFFTPKIDNWGHLGGLLAGFVIGYMLLLTGTANV